MKRILVILLMLFLLASVGNTATKQYVSITLSYAANKAIVATVRGDAYYFMTATGNCSITMTGGVRGDSAIFVITCDATPRVITFGSGFTSSGTLTLVASQISVVQFIYTGATWKEYGRFSGSGSLPLAVQGDTLYASATNTWASLSKDITATRYLANTGTNNNPKWDQINLANGVTGVLPLANGGTGQSIKAPAFDALSPAVVLGDLIYNNGTNNVKLAGNTTTTKNFLTQTGTGAVSAAPAWGTIAQADVSGLTTASSPTFNALTLTNPLTVGNGGTSKSAWTQWGIPYADTTTSFAQVAAGSAGQVLQSNGSAAPAWSTPTYPSTSQTAGKVLRSDGTNFVASTSTFADTYLINTLLYNATANTVSSLATGNSGVLVTSASGVPSIATDIPTAVTIGTKYVYRAEGTDVPVTDGGTGASDASTARTNLGLGTIATLNSPLPTANGGSPATRVIELFRSTYRPSPDGTSNSGILTDVYDTTNFINYTRWTSGIATQDYDIWYEAVLPTDFVSFSANALSVMVRSNDLAGNAITLSMYDNGNVVDTGISAVVLTPSIVDVWDTKTDTPDTPTTPYAAGHKVHILIKLKNDEAANTVDVAGLKLTYNTR